jgi:hypothetical protein
MRYSMFKLALIPLFPVFVDAAYEIPPFCEVLQTLFISIASPFQGKIEFAPIPACAAVVRTPRRLKCLYVKLGHPASTREVLKELERQGLRPALPEELISFHKAYRDEARTGPIVALGATTGSSFRPRVAVLDLDALGRRLDLTWVGTLWGREHRFLAVEETPTDT